MRKHASIASLAGQMALAAAIGFSGYYGFASGTIALDGIWAHVSGQCRIKGNISWGGERIYHVPGQEYYAETRIDLGRGERWFCSEDEARQAGWRRARL